MFVIPNTKHIASRMLDFPLPFRPVIELNDSSLFVIYTISYPAILLFSPDVLKLPQCELLFTHQPEIIVRTAYDLKPYIPN